MIMPARARPNASAACAKKATVFLGAAGVVMRTTPRDRHPERVSTATQISAPLLSGARAGSAVTEISYFPADRFDRLDRDGVEDELKMFGACVGHCAQVLRETGH